MTKIKCDVVKCKYNRGYICISNFIEITLNHIQDSNGIDVKEFIECSTMEVMIDETNKDI